MNLPHLSYFLMLLLQVSDVAYGDDKGCEIQLDARSESSKTPPPIIFDWTDGSIVYPDLELSKKKKTGIVLISNGQSVGLSCHPTGKRKRYFKTISSKKKPIYVVKVTCEDGEFKNEGTAVEVEKYKCSKGFDPEIMISNSTCASLGADGRDVSGESDGLKEVSIGWRLNGTTETFQTQISLCIDDQKYGTLWTKHVIQPSIEFKDIRKSRPGFKVDTFRLYRFFGRASTSTLNKVYTKRNQRKSIKKQLGTFFAEGQEVISLDPSSNNYLAKGHLTPDASMVYDFEQKATYYFINVAPQFQAFNNGNWKYLEHKARKLAELTGQKMTVYQGTQDILAYEDTSSQEQELYIEYTRKKKTTSVPIPLFFWKVIYDEVAKKGSASLV